MRHIYIYKYNFRIECQFCCSFFCLFVHFVHWCLFAEFQNWRVCVIRMTSLSDLFIWYVSRAFACVFERVCEPNWPKWFTFYIYVSIHNVSMLSDHRQAGRPIKCLLIIFIVNNRQLFIVCLWILFHFIAANKFFVVSRVCVCVCVIFQFARCRLSFSVGRIKNRLQIDIWHLLICGRFFIITATERLFYCGAQNRTEINEFCMKIVFGNFCMLANQSKESKTGLWSISIKPNWEGCYLSENLAFRLGALLWI